jgi:hypothetical protein
MRSSETIDSARRSIDCQPLAQVNSRRGMTSERLNWVAFCLLTQNPVLPCQFECVKRFWRRRFPSVGSDRRSNTTHGRSADQSPPRVRVALRSTGREGLQATIHGSLAMVTARPSGIDLATVQVLAHALLTKERPGRRAKPSNREVVANAQRRRSLRDAALVHTAYDLIAWKTGAKRCTGNGRPVLCVESPVRPLRLGAPWRAPPRSFSILNEVL